MPAHIGQRRQSLGFARHGGLRIAAGVAVQLPEERELNRFSATTAGTVPCAIVGIAARQVGVHRVIAVAVSKSYKLSTDAFFVEKIRDIVGLYLNPPDNALVLCVDEKSQVQALERTQPVLPMGLGYVEGVTHDYYRHGTTTLFAALDIVDGGVISQCKPRYRHQEFLSFLKHLDANIPADLEMHLIADNYATHKHPKVKAWLARYPRYRIHFTPTYSSWLNEIERCFALITQQAIRRGSFRNVRELVGKIDAYVAHYNEHKRPFVWTATPIDIRQTQRICKLINGTQH